MNGAFVGVSLDSREFPRSWVRYALPLLLGRHTHLLIVLANSLFTYTRSARFVHGAAVLQLADAAAAAARLCAERRRFFAGEVQRLGGALAGRVRVIDWDAYSDPLYCALLRRLQIAWSALPEFRQLVQDEARAHVVRIHGVPESAFFGEVGVAYLLDEVAMCIRIAELGDCSFEYHPGPELGILTAIYAGAFRARGLSIESLVGQPARRRFTPLYEPAEGAPGLASFGGPAPQGEVGVLP
jgi:hypothetical protein